jgi:2-desacetyl-2-hydroxyethyl bacteriochlorophyllide A dehydrogenase
VGIKREPIPDLRDGDLLVQTRFSGISPGTETLLYRGKFPSELLIDARIPALASQKSYPLKYGYSAVGEVVRAGSSDLSDWIGRLVFAFNPHEEFFIADPADLIPIPDDIAMEDAVFLSNMETAVNLVMDGRPFIGENVIVFGQGIVGLFTTGILAQFPLNILLSFDHYPDRRQASIEIGVMESFDPEGAGIHEKLALLLPEGADLVFELTGQPEAIDEALVFSGYQTRIVIGSWYGDKKAPLNLGGAFHRDRIRIISSQVSTIAPEFTGRWTKRRRFDTAWAMIRLLQPSRFITHRYPIREAEKAFQMLDQNPRESIQVIFTY